MHPMLCTPSMPPQAFVFRHRPAHQAPVEIAKRWIKCRLIVTAIVVHPTLYDRIEHPSQVVYPLVDTTAKLPAAHSPSDGFCCDIADTGTEVNEELSPPI